MSDTEITVVRWILLSIAIVALLQATVLLEFVEKQLFARWYTLNGRLGGSLRHANRETAQ